MTEEVRAILGIDAAWTLTQPSGVALVAKRSAGWRLIAAEPSYARFLGLTGRSTSTKDASSSFRLNPVDLLAVARTLSGRDIDVIAVDMPLARSPISARRFADDAVSRAFGRWKCGTHSPSPLRPGKISEDLTKAFERAGYSLQTNKIVVPALIEVYPHPALVELAGASERLPYKASKVRAYWPKAGVLERRERLYKQWAVIVSLLEGRIKGVADRLIIPSVCAGNAEMKAFEDSLDAIVCTWIGTCALEGCAIPYGDDQSAIWIPKLVGKYASVKSIVTGASD